MKLNYKRTVFVGLAFMTIQAVWQLYNTEIPIMLTKMIGDLLVEAGKASYVEGDLVTKFPITTVVNAIMSVDNIMAVFLLPILGRMSDNTKTRFGKRTPYIAVGVIAAAIALPFVPLFYAKGSIVGVAIMLGILLVAMSIYRSPAVALMPDVTPKSLRSTANSVINLMGAAGTVSIVLAALVVGKIFESGALFYTALFIAASVIILIAFLVFILTVNEPALVSEIPDDDGEETEEERLEREGAGIKMQSSKFVSLLFLLFSVAFAYMAYGAIETNFSRYATGILGLSDAEKSLPMMVAMGSALLCFVFFAIVSNRIGRKLMVLIGLSALAVCATLASFMTNLAVLYVLFALIGIGWAAININFYPMVVEVARGSDIGKYTGIFYTFQMAAQIATPLLSGVLIDCFSKVFDNGLRIMFPYASFFLLIALVVMSFVKHGDSQESNVEVAAEEFEIPSDEAV